MKAGLILLLMGLVIVSGCAQQDPQGVQPNGEVTGNMKLTSPAFENNGNIPSKYTCDGEDTSPELVIEGVPENAKSLALIVDDPDAPAGTWVHWLAWNIVPDTGKISEGSVPGGVTQGTNDFGKPDYGGPCPPSGTHRYFFKLYALDITLDLPQGVTKQQLEQAMQGHVLEQATLTGLYQRG
jgi:Raf kinase inhibitor-like YbhB/YbcL family protein